MEDCDSNSMSNIKKTKYINASVIFIRNEGLVPEDLQFTKNIEKRKTEDDVSVHDTSHQQVDPHISANIEIFSLKINFELSKEPIGLGRFGVVYKASNMKTKFIKGKSNDQCDINVQNIYHEMKKQLGEQSSLAVKMIRNKLPLPKTTKQINVSKKSIDGAFRYNKELSILKLLHHQNVVKLFCFSCDDIMKFHSEKKIDNENSCDHTTRTLSRRKTLNLFLSYMPTTLQMHLEKHGPLIKGEMSSENRLGIAFIKQLYIALEYLRSLHICHRDIKPSNILLDIENEILKLSDFGSAIQLSPKTYDHQVQIDSHLQSYVCSRYYRAPELILGSKQYGCEIDIWSAGCVVAEMVMAFPLFPGESAMDMLVEIVSLLGPPNSTELKQMNIGFNDFDDDEEEEIDTDDDDNGNSPLIDLMLSIRTFRTAEERLRDKLERTNSGRLNVSSEIVDLVLCSLQYIANNRQMSVPTFRFEKYIQ